MSSTGVAGALQVVLGGVAGSFLTWCLTWYREQRRMIDAAREPQRQAIAGIAAAAHELFIQQVRRSQLARDRANALEGKPLQFSPAQSFDGLVADLSRAIFGLTMAMQVGQLTVVDQQCVTAANAVQEAFNRVKAILKETSERSDADSLRKSAAEAESSIDNLQESVQRLVAVGRSRVAPTQGRWRRGSRKSNEERGSAPPTARS
jgi:Ni/Co efflux regulator RcnB